MADTSLQQQEMQEPLPPQTNGFADGLTEEEKSKMRPADIDADMREMERRKRVEMMMNSRLFKEELERIIETQMKDGAGPSGLLQQISEMMGPQGARFNANVFRNSNCVVPINDIRGVESMGYAKGEKVLRCKLAAVFRLLDLYGWTQGVGGLITARLNQDQEHFLVNPYGLLYHEVTASSLVKVDMQGDVVEQGTTNFGVHIASYQLHSTIHAARPDIKCIVHIATPSVTAISALKSGLLPLGQESIVIGEISNYHYISSSNMNPEEREKLARNFGPTNKVILLTNRGALCCGETVEEAFFNVYNTVLACETQLKLMPLGIDNLTLISDEARKAIYESSRKAPVPLQNSEKRWRIGGTEFEALMRMLDNAGFRTGYIYRHPLVKSEPPRPRNDVEVPPAVSSLGYLLEEEELYKQGLWKGGRKGTDRTRWLNSPNVYQKVEILETGTPDPKKITKWVSDGSPTHSSTPVKIEGALQFVPKNTNPKEFKQLQQQIKDYRRADKISAGPQSHILEGVTWEEAKKMQDATISGTGEQVVLVGAASKGIIQRGFQHNAMVYKTPYAKNPFDAVTDQELDQYKKEIERKTKGDIYDESQSESEALSSFNISRATHESSTAKSPIQSPVSVTSETEEESRDEPKVLRIETKQVPAPSQPEVVLSDGLSGVSRLSSSRSDSSSGDYWSWCTGSQPCYLETTRVDSLTVPSKALITDVWNASTIKRKMLKRKFFENYENTFKSNDYFETKAEYKSDDESKVKSKFEINRAKFSLFEELNKMPVHRKQHRKEVKIEVNDIQLKRSAGVDFAEKVNLPIESSVTCSNNCNMDFKTNEEILISPMLVKTGLNKYIQNSDQHINKTFSSIASSLNSSSKTISDVEDQDNQNQLENVNTELDCVKCAADYDNLNDNNILYIHEYQMTISNPSTELDDNNFDNCSKTCEYFNNNNLEYDKDSFQNNNYDDMQEQTITEDVHYVNELEVFICNKLDYNENLKNPVVEESQMDSNIDNIFHNVDNNLCKTKLSSSNITLLINDNEGCSCREELSSNVDTNLNDNNSKSNMNNTVPSEEILLDYIKEILPNEDIDDVKEKNFDLNNESLEIRTDINSSTNFISKLHSDSCESDQKILTDLNVNNSNMYLNKLQDPVDNSFNKQNNDESQNEFTDYILDSNHELKSHEKNKIEIENNNEVFINNLNKLNEIEFFECNYNKSKILENEIIETNNTKDPLELSVKNEAENIKKEMTKTESDNNVKNKNLQPIENSLEKLNTDKDISTPENLVCFEYPVQNQCMPLDLDTVKLNPLDVSLKIFLDNDKDSCSNTSYGNASTVSVKDEEELKELDTTSDSNTSEEMGNMWLAMFDDTINQSCVRPIMVPSLDLSYSEIDKHVDDSSPMSTTRCSFFSEDDLVIKRTTRRDSIAEVVSSINVDFDPSNKLIVDTLADTEISLKYNLDSQTMSLLYSITPPNDFGLTSKDTTVTEDILEDNEEDAEIYNDNENNEDILWDSLSNNYENKEYVNMNKTIELSEASVASNVSNQGSDILELPSQTSTDVQRSSDEIFHKNLSSSVNQILKELSDAEIFVNAANFVDEILFDIACLNLPQDIADLSKVELQKLIREKIWALNVAKKLAKNLVGNLPYSDANNSANSKVSNNEELSEVQSLDQSVYVIREIVHHIVDKNSLGKLDLKSTKTVTDKKVKECMNIELKGLKDEYDETDEKSLKCSTPKVLLTPCRTRSNSITEDQIMRDVENEENLQIGITDANANAKDQHSTATVVSTESSSATSQNFAEQEITTDSTDSDTKSDNSKEKQTDTGETLRSQSVTSSEQLISKISEDLPESSNCQKEEQQQPKISNDKTIYFCTIDYVSDSDPDVQNENGDNPEDSRGETDSDTSIRNFMQGFLECQEKINEIWQQKEEELEKMYTCERLNEISEVDQDIIDCAEKLNDMCKLMDENHDPVITKLEEQFTSFINEVESTDSMAKDELENANLIESFSKRPSLSPISEDVEFETEFELYKEEMNAHEILAPITEEQNGDLSYEDTTGTEDMTNSADSKIIEFYSCLQNSTFTVSTEGSSTGEKVYSADISTNNSISPSYITYKPPEEPANFNDAANRSGSLAVANHEVFTIECMTYSYDTNEFLQLEKACSTDDSNYISCE